MNDNFRLFWGLSRMLGLFHFLSGASLSANDTFYQASHVVCVCVCGGALTLACV